MIRRGLVILGVVAVGLGVNSCQPLRTAQPFAIAGRGDLAAQPMPYTNAIPAEYGDLIGVATNANYPSWTEAWFMKPDRSLVVVLINAGSGRIYDRMIEIPRR